MKFNRFSSFTAMLFLIGLTACGNSSSTTVVPVTCANGGTCIVGDVGPGGGTVFYVAPASFVSGAPCSSKCKYLEVSPQGWNLDVSSLTESIDGGCPEIGDNSKDPHCYWIGRGKFYGYPLQTENQIGAGFDNTMKAATQIAGPQNAIAISQDYRGGNRLDWFIPSKDELNELCKFARQQLTGDNSVACNESGALMPDFQHSLYWSSSEQKVNQPWAQAFDSNEFWKAGYQEASLVVATLATRPIRAF